MATATATKRNGRASKKTKRNGRASKTTMQSQSADGVARMKVPCLINELRFVAKEAMDWEGGGEMLAYLVTYAEKALWLGRAAACTQSPEQPTFMYDACEIAQDLEAIADRAERRLNDDAYTPAQVLEWIAWAIGDAWWIRATANGLFPQRGLDV